MCAEKPTLAMHRVRLILGALAPVLWLGVGLAQPISAGAPPASAPEVAASGAPAPAPVAGARSAGVVAVTGGSAPTSGSAPTIEALSTAQRAKLAADVEERWAKVLAVSAPASAAVSTPSILRVAPAPPPPDTTKTVVAIYGRFGEEVADVRLPNGSIVTVRGGSNVDGFRVIRVTSKGAEFAVPPRRSRAAKKSVKPIGTVARQSDPTTSGASAVIQVAVGGTFK